MIVTAYLQNLCMDFESLGGLVILNNEVSLKIDMDQDKFYLIVKDKNTANQFILETEVLVNCAGVNAYKIANSIYGDNTYQPKYMKGDYYSYSGKEKLKHLIYPAPQEFSLEYMQQLI